MRYIVTVNGERVEVVLGENGITVDGQEVHAHLADIEGTPIRVLTAGDRVYRIIARREQGRGQYTLWMGGFSYQVEAVDERSRAIRDLSAVASATSGPAPILAPMPGLIVRISVNVGDRVEAGQGVIVMEAMKMENELRATSGGTVSAVRVQPGTAVEKGTVLLELEPKANS